MTDLCVTTYETIYPFFFNSLGRLLNKGLLTEINLVGFAVYY